MERVLVIGGELAGSEVAWQAAQQVAKVTLFEMRPHRNGVLAELLLTTP